MSEQEMILKDVFVSYSSADQTVVEQIARKLEDADLNVFYAPADIRGGEAFIQEIETGLRTSRVVVTFFSASALRSFWVEKEWNIRLVQMSEDPTLKLIPVLLHSVQGEQLPATLRTFHRLDFRDTDWNSPVKLQGRVDELVQHIRDELPPPGVKTIGIPFVIFAMTREEASELVSESIFEDPDADVRRKDPQRFARLIETLGEHGITDILQFYGKTRDEWSPPVTKPAAIRETIEEMVRLRNEQRPLASDQPVIRPQFFSTDFLSDRPAWRSRTWYELGYLGCVLIVDAISMFHPLLRDSLAGSEFGSNKKVSIIVLSPVGADKLLFNQFLEERFKEDQQMVRAFQRFEDDFDMLCEFGIGDACHLKRWLFSVLPRTADIVRGLEPDPGSKRAMHSVGERRGMERAIFGGGGR